jgi:hypothetical protein
MSGQPDNTTAAKVEWMRGPDLRKRWGSMANSTFYNRLERGLIPPPEYPFGTATPYWRLDVIEAHERGPKPKAAANVAPKPLTSSKDMTLRDYFAAKAMQAYLGTYPCAATDDVLPDMDALASDAYELADAMLKARSA